MAAHSMMLLMVGPKRTVLKFSLASNQIGSSSIWQCRILIFEYFFDFWIFPLRLPAENNNKYSKFNMYKSVSCRGYKYLSYSPDPTTNSETANLIFTNFLSNQIVSNKKTINKKGKDALANSDSELVTGSGEEDKRKIFYSFFTELKILSNLCRTKWYLLKTMA